MEHNNKVRRRTSQRERVSTRSLSFSVLEVTVITEQDGKLLEDSEQKKDICGMFFNKQL